VFFCSPLQYVLQTWDLIPSIIPLQKALRYQFKYFQIDLDIYDFLMVKHNLESDKQNNHLAKY